MASKEMFISRSSNSLELYSDQNDKSKGGRKVKQIPIREISEGPNIDVSDEKSARLPNNLHILKDEQYSTAKMIK